MLPKVTVNRNLPALHECPTCKKLFFSEALLKKHSTVHIKIHKCDMCQQQFPRVGLLNRHINIKHVKYKCRLCSAHFANKWYVKTHMKIHKSESKQFTCHLCQKQFTSKGGLNVHLRGVHCREKRVVCKACKKCFFARANLLVHIKQVHMKALEQYVCDICGKGFKYKTRLKVHLRTHTDERPYSCPICGKAFIETNGLKHHLISHKQATPHQCAQCPKTFKSKDSLNAHLLTHNTVKVFECATCSKLFTTIRNVRNHEKNHVKQHICRGCGKRYPVRRYLVAHQEKKGCLHNMPPEVDGKASSSKLMDHLGNKLVLADAVRSEWVESRNKMVRHCILSAKRGMPKILLTRLSKRQLYMKTELFQVETSQNIASVVTTITTAARSINFQSDFEKFMVNNFSAGGILRSLLSSDTNASLEAKCNNNQALKSPVIKAEMVEPENLLNPQSYLDIHNDENYGHANQQMSLDICMAVVNSKETMILPDDGPKASHLINLNNDDCNESNNLLVNQNSLIMRPETSSIMNFTYPVPSGINSTMPLLIVSDNKTLIEDTALTKVAEHGPPLSPIKFPHQISILCEEVPSTSNPKSLTGPQKQEIPSIQSKRLDFMQNAIVQDLTEKGKWEISPMSTESVEGAMLKKLEGIPIFISSQTKERTENAVLKVVKGIPKMMVSEKDELTANTCQAIQMLQKITSITNYNSTLSGTIHPQINSNCIDVSAKNGGTTALNDPTKLIMDEVGQEGTVVIPLSIKPSLNASLSNVGSAEFPPMMSLANFVSSYMLEEYESIVNSDAGLDISSNNLEYEEEENSSEGDFPSIHNIIENGNGENFSGEDFPVVHNIAKNDKKEYLSSEGPNCDHTNILKQIKELGEEQILCETCGSLLEVV